MGVTLGVTPKIIKREPLRCNYFRRLFGAGSGTKQLFLAVQRRPETPVNTRVTAFFTSKVVRYRLLQSGGTLGDKTGVQRFFEKRILPNATKRHCNSSRQACREGMQATGRERVVPADRSEWLKVLAAEVPIQRQGKDPSSRSLPRRRAEGWRRTRPSYFENRLVHHWDSHGTPSPSPSIWVFGQFLRKYVASAQEVICEQ